MWRLLDRVIVRLRTLLSGRRLVGSGLRERPPTEPKEPRNRGSVRHLQQDIGGSQFLAVVTIDQSGFSPRALIFTLTSIWGDA